MQRMKLYEFTETDVKSMFKGLRGTKRGDRPPHVSSHGLLADRWLVARVVCLDQGLSTSGE